MRLTLVIANQANMVMDDGIKHDAQRTKIYKPTVERAAMWEKITIIYLMKERISQQAIKANGQQQGERSNTNFT